MALSLVPAPSRLDTPEDVADAYDAWCRGDSTREMRDRRIDRGNLVVLFERGAKVAEGRGRGMINALAAALEALS